MGVVKQKGKLWPWGDIIFFMGERISKPAQAVVFRTPEGTLAWDTLENSKAGTEVIKERESLGNRVVLVISPEKAREMVKQQTGQNQEFVLC